MKRFSKIIIGLFLGSSFFTLKAQHAHSEWQLGYFAPFISNRGVAVGYALDVIPSKSGSNLEATRQSRIQFLAQLSYFSQVGVSHNAMLNPEWMYKWNPLQKRFFITTSLGTGYLLTFQRQDGILNLSTGEIDYHYRTLHYFLPNVNLGLGVDPKKYLGFYLKATYGISLSSQNAQATFLSLSTGMIVKF